MSDYHNKQKCEYRRCKRRAMQADTYLNIWLCDDHYSTIGRITEDYQAERIDWDKLERSVEDLSLILKQK